MNKGHQLAVALVTFSIVTIVSSCRTRPTCILRGVPYSFTATEIGGLWIGTSTATTDLYRLELRSNGAGALTKVYTGSTNAETSRFEISKWDINTNNVLTCAFSQQNVEESLKLSWPVKLSCQVFGDRMEALLRNGEGGWKENIVFVREREFDQKLRALRQQN